MNRWNHAIAAAALAAVAYTNTAYAQTPDTIATRAHQSSTTLRISKWSALAATLGAAVYGFSENRTADASYATLEQACVANRLNCARRTAQAFADPELERQYQAVRALDKRAHAALIASQVGVATTVVLFVMDLRHKGPPRDIPYKPRTLDVSPNLDGSVRVQLSIPLGSALQHD